jgi:hypothetical protein
MTQYWLKPMGHTQPKPSPIADDWVSERGLDDFVLTTGPANVQDPPQMGRGDRVLLVAVVRRRVFAEGEILGDPTWQPGRPDGDRWPWLYRCRIETWVPLVKDGPRTTDLAPEKVVGRIQAGGECARLTKDEYHVLLGALLASPTVHTV